MTKMINSDGPRIHLAVDNCFASKRWCRPDEWMALLKDLSISNVEASADNECDPLYAGPDYLADWLEQVLGQGERHGVKVVNLYSGHGTYATLGLAHSDIRVRDRIQHEWLEKMIQSAAKLGAGLGFFCHAFPQAILDDAKAYHCAAEDLEKRLADLAAFAAEAGVRTIGVEQMYAPHLIPWTIGGAAEMMAKVVALGGCPLYITIDVGHQCGQARFQRPGRAEIEKRIRGGLLSAQAPLLWLGPQTAHDCLDHAILAKADTQQVLEDLSQTMAEYPHLFAKPWDAQPYAWIEQLSCYSPIIHLQQTDGTASRHLPFSEENNKAGIINGPALLSAIARSYEREATSGMPPRCSDIYLTIEVFSSTAANPRAIVRDIAESVDYWRQVVPEDGRRLSELL